MGCSSFKSCINMLEKNGVKEKTCLLPACLKSFDTRRMAVVEENKKKYQLINSNSDNIAVFSIDGGMIPEKDIIKCDNLLVDMDSRLAIFVELKGTDLKHALEQVEATVTRLLPGLLNYRILARIVTSNRTNVPDIKSCPQYVKLAKKVLANRGNVTIHSNIITDNVASI